MRSYIIYALLITLNLLFFYFSPNYLNILAVGFVLGIVVVSLFEDIQRKQ